MMRNCLMSVDIDMREKATTLLSWGRTPSAEITWLKKWTHEESIRDLSRKSFSLSREKGSQCRDVTGGTAITFHQDIFP